VFYYVLYRWKEEKHLSLSSMDVVTVETDYVQAAKSYHMSRLHYFMTEAKTFWNAGASERNIWDASATPSG
jgi:hypothetical protein